MYGMLKLLLTSRWKIFKRNLKNYVLNTQITYITDKKANFVLLFQTSAYKKKQLYYIIYIY